MHVQYLISHKAALIPQVEAFLEEHRGEELVEKAAQEAVRTVRARVVWREKSYPDISQWLLDHGYTVFEEGESQPTLRNLEDDDVVLANL